MTASVRLRIYSIASKTLKPYEYFFIKQKMNLIKSAKAKYENYKQKYHEQVIEIIICSMMNNTK